MFSLTCGIKAKGRQGGKHMKVGGCIGVYESGEGEQQKRSGNIGMNMIKVHYMYV
jgi:hypothetical protein